MTVRSTTNRLRLRFRLGTKWYSLPAATVCQIAPLGPIHSVPGAPDGVRGLVEFRGRILTLLDPARLSGIDPGRRGRTEVAVLLNPPHQHLALAVAGLPEVGGPGGSPEDGGGGPAGPGGTITGSGKPDPIRELQVEELLAECGRRIAESVRAAGRTGAIGGIS